MDGFLKNLLKAAVHCASGTGRRPRLTILIYHRVLPDPDPMLRGAITAKEFDRGMSILSGLFNVLPLHEAVERLKSGSLPKRAACITFDDGYADNAETALPILRKYNLPAAFFIAVGYINKGIMWNDIIIETVRRIESSELDLEKHGLGVFPVQTLEEKIASAGKLISGLKYQQSGRRKDMIERIRESAPVKLPDNLMMTSEQLLMLDRADMEIGGHTVSHPILACVSDEEALTEITGGKRKLEDYLDRPIRYFAYPNGKPGKDYASRHVVMVRNAGFKAALSTAWGAAASGTDMFQLPRFTPWEKDQTRFALRLASNYLRSAGGVSF